MPACFVKKADPLVLQDLDKEGKLLMLRNSSMIIRTAGDAIHH